MELYSSDETVHDDNLFKEKAGAESGDRKNAERVEYKIGRG